MSTFSYFLSETRVGFDHQRLQRIAQQARGRGAGWLKEILSYLDDFGPRFSLRFFDGTRFFGYPRPDRALLLHVLAACLKPPRGAKQGLGRFRIESGEPAEVRIDYVKSSIELWWKEGENWRRDKDKEVKLPPSVDRALRTDSASSGTPAVGPRISKGFAPNKAYEFRNPRGEKVWLGWRKISFYRWVLSKGSRYYIKRVEISNNPRLSGKDLMRHAAERLLKKGFSCVAVRSFISENLINIKKSKTLIVNPKFEK